MEKSGFNGGSRGGFGDKRSSFGDKRSSFGDKKSSFGDKRSSFGDRRSSFGDRGGRGGFGDRGGRGGFGDRGSRGGFGDRGSRGGFGDRGGRGGFGDRGGDRRGRGGFGTPGGRGRGRGRGGGGGAGRGGGGSSVMIIPHRHEGVFIAKGKEEVLVTLNLNPGSSVYGEKRISVENESGEKIEYRVWNPFRSKLAAAILGGIGQIGMKPGSKVLYLGAANGTTVSHVSDLVGPEGTVYAVEFSHRSGRDLLASCQKRMNIVPIVEDARYPAKYRMVVGPVDVIFADVAQPDQARIVGINAEYFLKTGGFFVMSIKAACIDSTAASEAVFASETNKLRTLELKPIEQLTLEPYERDHAVVVGTFRTQKK